MYSCCHVRETKIGCAEVLQQAESKWLSGFVRPACSSNFLSAQITSTDFLKFKYLDSHWKIKSCLSEWEIGKQRPVWGHNFIPTCCLKLVWNAFVDAFGNNLSLQNNGQKNEIKRAPTGRASFAIELMPFFCMKYPSTSFMDLLRSSKQEDLPLNTPGALTSQDLMFWIHPLRHWQRMV